MLPLCETLQLAVQHLNSGNLSQAALLCRRVLLRNTHPSDALVIMGLIFHRAGKSDAAIVCMTEAIARNPDQPEYYYNLGFVFEAMQQFDNAIQAYQNALLLKPDYTQALNNLGLILYEQNRLSESIVLFQRAIRTTPDFTNAYYNLGKAYQALGQPEAAIRVYDQVLKAMPDSRQTRFNRSLALLSTGNWSEGWREYECRFSRPADAHVPGDKNGWQRWNGAAFDGRQLLVLDEQGIGDTLQFIRYLPMVKERGGTVDFATVRPLIGLLQGVKGADQLLDVSTVAQYDRFYDLYVPLMSLPGIFQTVLETIPGDVPYIYPDAIKVRYWAKRLSKDRFNVGIVWAGKTSNEYRRKKLPGLLPFFLQLAGEPASSFASNRLTSLDYFAPFAQIPGIQLYGLQKGTAAAQGIELCHRMQMISLGQEFDDFSDTAAAIANMDLIISVDTAVAHLAGAMAKPVWILLPFVADWRWLREREDSPWYPTARLFRQQTPNDWGAVFEQVAGELHMLVRQKAIK